MFIFARTHSMLGAHATGAAAGEPVAFFGGTQRGNGKVRLNIPVCYLLDGETTLLALGQNGCHKNESLLGSKEYGMNRRNVLGVLGGTAAALAREAALTQTRGGRGRSSSRGSSGHRHSQATNECAEACSRCAQVCNETAHHCYEEASEGEEGHLKALHYLVDCQAICATSAALCARQSPLMAYCCQSCASACEACIKVCEQMDDDEGQVEECIAALRECAESCGRMASSMKGGRR